MHKDDASIYSFGYGSNGPVVNPFHKGKPETVDKGLIPNTNDLVESIVNELKILVIDI